MEQTLFALLRTVDTPTVCNAIEVVDGKRGFGRYTRATLLSSAPSSPALVGYARTARIAAATPPDSPPTETRARRMAYYKYMADGPLPAIAVVEDVDFPHATGAFWGEINTTVHKGFGLCGALTNGVMRDLGDLPQGFPVIAGSIGPSHAHVHVLDIDCDVTIMGLRVKPMDIVHADRHGAVIVPKSHLPEIERAIRDLLSTEQIVLSAARKPDFDFEKFEIAWTAFEKART